MAKGFLGTHSATDTFYKWLDYGDLIGGYFNEHPWMQVHAEIDVEDRTFPATKHFPAHFPIYDEIYQFKEPYSRDKVRVLMSIDPKSVDLKNPRVHRTDQDFAVTWVRQYGKGRVFYSSLGHREEVWDRPDIQQMWTEAVKWAMGMIPGDATPRPKPARVPHQQCLTECAEAGGRLRDAPGLIHPAPMFQTHHQFATRIEGIHVAVSAPGAWVKVT
jgi:type 1 glutamine amidotransferase